MLLMLSTYVCFTFLDTSSKYLVLAGISALIVAWARFGWGSVRRIPGVNTHEEVSA